jgi:hypothetical protein
LKIYLQILGAYYAISKSYQNISNGGVMLMGLSLLSQPAQALNWNFSYTADNVGGDGVPGTVDAILTTDGTDYNITDLYTITGISGTANNSSIVGLWTTAFPAPSSLYSTDNQFRWDGATGIILSFDGIAFSNSASQFYNIFDKAGDLRSYINSTSGSQGYELTISSSSLTPTPVPWETDALPVVGSTVLFGFGLWAKRKFAKPLQK